MIVAIMQPYFFPYIGYFQLMRAVDTFVFFDDVQYINRGWVNRNQISVDGTPAWLSMPIRRASRSLAINQREYLLEEGVPLVKRKVKAAYRKIARADILDTVDALLDFPDANVARFNANLLRDIAVKLVVGCRFVNASDIVGETEGLRGEAKVVEICKRLRASHYINPIGGTRLYDPAHFAHAGIKLSFLRTTAAPCLTVDGPVHFSIIDLLMRLGVAGCRDLLAEYEVLEPAIARASCA